MKSTTAYIITLIGFLGLNIGCNQITEKTEHKVQEYTAQDSVQVTETLVRENNRESMNRELDLKYPNGVRLLVTDNYDDGTIDNIMSIKTDPSGKVRTISEIENNRKFMGFPLEEDIKEYLPKDRLNEEGQTRAYLTADNIKVIERAVNQGSQFELIYDNGVHIKVEELNAKIKSIYLIDNPNNVMILLKYHPDQEFMRLPNKSDIKKYFSQEWKEKGNIDNPALEGVVFKTKYVPEISGGLFKSGEDSKFYFSIDSGRVLINVENTSSKSLEELASSITKGSKVRFEVDKKYTHSRRYSIDADKIEIL